MGAGDVQQHVAGVVPSKFHHSGIRWVSPDDQLIPQGTFCGVALEQRIEARHPDG